MSFRSTSGRSALSTSSFSVSYTSTAGAHGRLDCGSLSIRLNASSKRRRLARGSKWLSDMVWKLLFCIRGILEALLAASFTYDHKICAYRCQLFFSMEACDLESVRPQKH